MGQSKKTQKQPLIAHAKRLASLGYVTVPIHTGSGAPVIKWKDKLPFTDEQMNSWVDKFPNTSVALIPGYNGVAMLDFDVTWTPLCRKMIYQLRKRWPNMPIRRCNDPKFAIVFTIGDSLLDYKNGWSDTWGTSTDDKQEIEYKGYNTPVTVLGQHRKTGKTYSWGKANRLTSTDIEDLPVLEFTDVDMIMGWFNNAMESESKTSPNWRLQRLRKQAFTSKLQTSESVVLPDDQDDFQDEKVIYTQKQVDDMLKNWDGDLRDGWLDAGRALHAHYQGSKEGLLRWIEWSEQWESFEQGQCEVKWAELADDHAHPFTLHGLKKKVKTKLVGEKKTALEAAVDRYVLITRGSFVGDLESPTSARPHRLADVKNAKKHQSIPYMKATGDEGHQELMTVWLQHQDCRVVEDVNYYPSHDRTFKDQGLEFWNEYAPTQCEIVEEVNEPLVKVFTDHLKYLFQGDEDYKWIMSWVAHLVQSPHERPTVTPLHIAKETRTGRGWLTEVFAKLVGKNNTDSADINEMVNSKAKNGYLANTTLVFVNEAKQTDGGKYSINDKLKTILTERRQNVDVKWGDQSERDVYARFFFQSQHLDAIVMDEDGSSRFQIFATTDKPRTTAYYDRLYSVLENKEFINSVYTMLMSYPVVRNGLFRSTMTEAKRKLIQASQSPTSQAFFAFKKCVGSYPFPENVLSNYVNDYLSILFEEDMISVNSSELSYLKKTHLPLRKIYRDEDVSVVVRAFNEHTDITNLKESFAVVQDKINMENIYA